MAKKSKDLTIQEIEDSYEEWKSDEKLFQMVKARNDKKRKDLKEGKINMRVNGIDLRMLMLKAEEKGMGYQTLLGSLIHLYVNDNLVEVSEARKVLGVEKKIVRAKTTKKRA